MLPSETLPMAADHAAMDRLAGLRVGLAGLLQHAVIALVTDVVHLNGLDGPLYFRHGLHSLTVPDGFHHPLRTRCCKCVAPKFARGWSPGLGRSEERRVGKACRERGARTR